MDLREFWSVKLYGMVTTPYSGIYEFAFTSEALAEECYLDICRKLNMIKCLRPEAVEYSDSFGLRMCVPLDTVVCVLFGKHSDFHKRAVDIQDTQETIARKYEREEGPVKPGFSPEIKDDIGEEG